MSRASKMVVGACVCGVVLTAMCGAAQASPTGDTCAATGNGTTYQLVITIPSTAPSQGGFAVGAPGAKVTNMELSENASGGGAPQEGAVSTDNLPANTTAAWLLGNSPVMAGQSLTASVRTSGPVTGSFTIVPATADHTGYFDPFLCALRKGGPVQGSVLGLDRHFIYNSATATWRSFITVGGPGRVKFYQRRISPNAKTQPSVHAGGMTAARAGRILLTLKPTAAGKVALERSGALKVNLAIIFSPQNGTPVTKLASITLQK